MNGRTWIMAGALFGALGVGMGAFGAHKFKDSLAESGRTDTYETAVRYQMYHALALVLIGLLAVQAPSTSANVAGGCFAAGILIFSGLLYVYALGGPKILGAIVPIGGVAFIVGWVALALASLQLAQK